MKIFTYNVNSVNARLPMIMDWLKDEAPEVCAFQEIKCLEDKFPSEAFESLGYNIVILGQKSYNGVALISKYPMSDIRKGLDGEPKDEQARYIEAVIDAPSPVRVASIYLPNGNPVGTDKYDYKKRWYDRLSQRAADILKYEEVSILCGDFNTIPTKSDLYKESVWLDDALYQPEIRASFQGLKNLGFTDAFEALPPKDNRYTYWDYQGGAWPKNEGIRIDHLLLSPQATDKVLAFDIHKYVRGKVHETAKPSDHVPVGITLSP
jgi:exodeoxyribonuclease III